MRHNPLLYKASPRSLWIFTESWRAFAGGIAFTLWMVYQAKIAGLDALQLVAVGTALEIGVLLFEVPTGIVADVYSRRVSVMIGAVVVGAGFIIMGTMPSFWPIAFGSFIWGVGHTFFSGAGQAWLSDEIGEDKAGDAFLASAQWQQLAAAAGIVISVVIGWRDLAAPVWICGFLYLFLAGVLLCVMPEDGYRPTPIQRRNTFSHMAQTFRAGLNTIRARPLMVTLILITLVFAAQSESYDRLWTKHLLDNFDLPVFTDLPLLGAASPDQSEVLWFGIIRMVSLLIGAVVLQRVRRRIDSEDPESVARGLWLVIVGLVALFLLFANAGAVWISLLCLFLIGPLRSIVGPLHLSLINRGIDPRVRATVLSMDGQTDAVGQLVGGIPLGWVGNVFGVRAAITGGALLLIPGIWLGGRAVRLARGLSVEQAPPADEIA
ncbi:MAG: MFS transporter [Chloroflexi bacterium]|nr:MFS transporter [Chloroflexota bacterium]